MKDDNCCLDCKNRKPLCHSVCEKYLNYRKKLDFINKNKKLIKENESLSYRRRRFK